MEGARMKAREKRIGIKCKRRHRKDKKAEWMRDSHLTERGHLSSNENGRKNFFFFSQTKTFSFELGRRPWVKEVGQQPSSSWRARLLEYKGRIALKASPCRERNSLEGGIFWYRVGIKFWFRVTFHFYRKRWIGNFYRLSGAFLAVISRSLRIISQNNRTKLNILSLQLWGE